MKVEVKNLSDVPHLYSDVLKLIEEGFNYPHEYNFEIDFYPLVAESNFKNCFLLFVNDELAGHIGAKPRKFKFQEETLDAVFYGGIVISSKFRGNGLYNSFFQLVLDHYKDMQVHLLWSDLTSLYNRFDFFESGRVFFHKRENHAPELEELGYINTKTYNLSALEKSQLQALYNDGHTHFFQPIRNEQDWINIFNITSAELWIKREDNQITAYCFRGKGADLQDIIHEAYPLSSHQKLSDNNLWSPLDLNKKSQTIFLAFFKQENKILDPNKTWVSGMDSI